MITWFEKYFRIVLAIYQIIGGLNGLSSFSSISYLEFLSHLIIYTVLIGLFTFSVYCGTILLLNRQSGYKLTLVNQYFQSAKILLLGYGYEYYMGFQSFIGFTDTPKLKFLFKTDLVYSSKGYFYFNDGNYEVSVVFNLIPILLIILIYKFRAKQLIEKNNCP